MDKQKHRFEQAGTRSGTPADGTGVVMEFALGDGAAARRCVSILRGLSDVHQESATRYRSTLYDSFDGRMHRKGLLLTYDEHAKGGELVLRPLRGRGGRWRQVLAGAPDAFREDIGDAGVRRRLDGILGLRALLPAVTVEVRRRSFRLLDDERKTHAWVHLDRAQIAGDQTEGSSALACLLIEPLRGYGKSARRLAKHLVDRAGLVQDPEGLMVRAAELSGVDFELRRAGFNVALQPEMRSDAAMRKVLLSLLRVMDANEQGVMDRLDTEFLHDFRIAVRRTRSLLAQVKRVFPASQVASFRREFAWLGRVTTTARDVDVYLLSIPRYRAMLLPELRDQLSPLQDLLERRRKKEYGRLVRALGTQRYARLKRRWHEYLAREPDATADNGAGAAPVLATANRRIHSTFKRVLREGRDIDDDSPAERLHEMRKTCKKLRYLVECFQSLYDPEQISIVLKQLKRLQDNLGEFQDLDVQINALHGSARDLQGRSGAADAVLAMGALFGIFDQRRRQVRAEFNERFARFSGKRNRERCRRLFRPEADGQ